MSKAHYPAFAVVGLRTHACMMAERIVASENKEFPKISINSDKFTGFIDKFQAIYFPGK